MSAPTRAPRHAPVSGRLVALACACLLAGCAAWSAVAPAASTSTIVSVTVPSATNLTSSACPSGDPGRTDLGTVLPGASAVTTADCTLTWGSSNDTAMLRAYQQDGRGAAAYSWTVGELDTSFNASGFQTHAPGALADTIEDAAMQPDGMVVVAGWSEAAAAQERLYLARYTSAGALDPAFNGGSGFVVNTTGTESEAHAVAIQADGRIVVAGGTYLGGTFQLLVQRFSSAGVLEGTYTFDAADCYAQAVAIQADAKIVVAGKDVNTGDVCLARLTSAGALDTTFGGGAGYVVESRASWDEAHDLLIDSSGRYVIAGESASDVLVARYASDGTPDASFNGGRTLTNLNLGLDSAYAIAQQDDGRLVVAASTHDSGWSNWRAAALRYTTGGLLDTFGTGGVTYGTDHTFLRDVALQTDGRIILAGDAGNGGAKDTYAMRLTPSGAADATFGSNGVATIDSGSTDEAAHALVLNGDGEAFLAGRRMNANLDTGLVQLKAAAAINDYDAASFNWAGTGANLFGACLRAVSGSGVTATWATGACGASDVAWNPIARTGTSAGSTIASSTTASTTNATASLRFGMRTAVNQRPGAYVAPIAFEVLAPNA